MITERVENNFANELRYFKEDIERLDKITNLHHMMFSLYSRALQESFIKDDRRSGIVSGNRTLSQCRDIIDFVDDYFHDGGVVLDVNGCIRKSKAIGLLEDELEEVLYIWEAIIKTEFVAFQYLCAGEFEDTESFDSHMKYVDYLKSKLGKYND